jgi:hypothetical protein
VSFARIAETEWLLHQRIKGKRRRFLVNSPPFEEILRGISTSACLVSYKRERHDVENWFRAKFTFRTDPLLVDLFHNSSTGYRAQFYRNAKTGERANSHAVTLLLRKALGVIGDPAEVKWARRSSDAEGTKIWIHQGKWLRQQAYVERNLLVMRWTTFLDDEDKMRRKHARWAMLTPYDEELIEIKGGYLTRVDVPVGAQKRDRAGQLHDYGFT